MTKTALKVKGTGDDLRLNAGGIAEGGLGAGFHRKVSALRP
jgi:hypothetical protein